MAGSARTPVSDNGVSARGLGKLVVNQVDINQVEERWRESILAELYRTNGDGSLNQQRREGETTENVHKKAPLSFPGSPAPIGHWQVYRTFQSVESSFYVQLVPDESRNLASELNLTPFFDRAPDGPATSDTLPGRVERQIVLKKKEKS